MNHITPRPSETELLGRFNKLPANVKTILWLKSLVYQPTSKPDFHACAVRLGLTTSTGKLWTATHVSEAVNELRGLGLLTEALVCPPALVHRMTQEAVKSPEAETLLAAVRRTFPVPIRLGYHALSEAEAIQRHVRLTVYANDPAEFNRLEKQYHKAYASNRAVQILANVFAGTPLTQNWLSSRHEDIRNALVRAKLLVLSVTGTPSADLPMVIDYARADLPFAETQDSLLRYGLLACRFEDVRDDLGRMDGTAPDKVLAVQASLDFLQGRNDAALAGFRDALKIQRKRLGKRKVFLEDPYRVFFLMALLRANDAALHVEMQAGIDAALAGSEYLSVFHSSVLVMQALLFLSQGLEPRVQEVMDRLRPASLIEPLSMACLALAEHILDAGTSRQQVGMLNARFDEMREVMPLIARIYAEILATVTKKPAYYNEFLTATGSAATVEFTKLIQTKQPWERALQSLDVFLGGGEGKADADKTPRKAKRLAWFLDPDEYIIEVAEQAAKGRDGWTDGRPVAMKRLHEQDPRLDYLTDQDRKALRTIRRGAQNYYGDADYEFDVDRTILALVGHPAVFDARHRAQPLELVSYPLELVVAEKDGGYNIALSHHAAAPAVFLEPETLSRYRVVEFPQKLLAVQEILGPKGLTVPKTARDQVIAMVRRNNPTLPIRSEIEDVDQPGVEGVSAPVVQLVPYEQGLRLGLLVRPFGPQGPAYVAGLGGRSVLARIGGVQQRANRDLVREQAERAALIEACPTLRDRLGTESHEVIVEDLEGSLDLLLELQSYPNPVAIEWPEGRKMKVSAVDPGKMKLRVSGDRNWFSIDGSVELDEDQVLEMRFLLDRLDRAQGRFVPLDDGRFVALTHQLQTQLQRLAAVSEPHKDGRRVHALGAPALDAVLEDAGSVKADAAWKKHIARIRSAEGWTPVLPPTLQAELRDYQIEGFVWMSRLARWGAGACLADDMGLGKTVQTIAVMLDRSSEGPILVVAPTSVCPNWVAEMGRFAPTLRVHRLSAVGDRAALIGGLAAGDVLVCSYGLLHQAAEALAEREWNMVVLDEAQAIKNAETKRAQAVQSLRAGFRLALSGTPVENYLDELWSLFSFVNPGVLGSRESFAKRFSGPIERAKDPHARQALRALIRPFLLRRTKAAVLSELPPRTEQTINVEMSEAERAYYEALRRQSLERLEALSGNQGRRKIQILAEITRLRRACCNPALIDAAAGVPSGKLAAFMELVEELIRNRHRALVFSQFVGHLELVRKALDAAGIRYEYLDGSTPSAERERLVASFQAGGADLFLISLRAGGTGLNLTAADYVVHLDPWWNPAVEDQASDRAHRIGQERPVTVYRLIMQGSIEEQILALHRDKRDLASDLLDGTETTGRLSEEALLDLIRG